MAFLVTMSHGNPALDSDLGARRAVSPLAHGHLSLSKPAQPLPPYGYPTPVHPDPPLTNSPWSSAYFFPSGQELPQTEAGPECTLSKTY